MVRLRRRSPVGHRNHGARAVPYTSHHFAWCECGFSERTISEGAAAGALAAHLREARPGAPTDVTYVGDDVEDRLAVALRALVEYRTANYFEGTRSDTLDAAIDSIETALAHYRIRLTQPERP